MTEHTPGPWATLLSTTIHADGTDRQADIWHGTFCIAKDIDWPNAKLIAAAPDLLEASKRLIQHRHQGDLHAKDFQRLEAAISKATQ